VLQRAARIIRSPLFSAWETGTPPVPASFSVDAFKIETSTEAPDYTLRRMSLQSVSAKHTIRLSIYVRIEFPSGTPFVTAFRLTSGSHTTLFKQTHHSLGSDSVGNELRFAVTYAPQRQGEFTFAGTVFIEGKHKHKTVAFLVRPA
jgi:hypothetical protein